MISQPVYNTVGKRYILYESLGSGGMGTVYRAIDRLTHSDVALKRVIPETLSKQGEVSQDHREFRLALAREFKLLASIRHPYIIEVRDYGFDEAGNPYYTMELLENPQDILQASADQSINERLHLVTQVLQALRYLHRRDILHRDLKPANVQVVNGRVKVLDFGLSVVRRRLSDADETDIAVGTLNYMAPEVLLGHTASPASDLYSLGILIYEMLSGQHPYGIFEPVELVNKILYQVPDVSQLDINEGLAKIIQRLLTKDIEARYQSADEVLQDIRRSDEHLQTGETVAIRESFLQSAEFIGREQEFTTLNNALQSAIQGKGSVCLIAGESGVGKSRLMDELRTEAMVEGALVISGQTIQDSGSPYHLWRMPFGWLPLLNNLPDSDIQLLKATIPEVPIYDDKDEEVLLVANPRQARMKLANLMKSTLGQLEQTCVLMLEDLHWAGSESLSLLKQLVSMAEQMRLLVVASFRDDERPDLLNFLPDAPVIKLNRLSESDIKQLSVAMIGKSGNQSDVVDLLKRETEGNVFFIIEVIRVLAEEAGELDQIGMMTLPEHVFAGGMWRIIHHRLEQLDDETKAPLQLAAVIGRELDLKLIQEMMPELNMERWLLNCSNAAVLDVTDNQWRFVHNRYRDGVLEGISEHKRRMLHAQVARGIEAVYGRDDEHVSALAHHWGMANNRTEEAYYCEIAGDQSLAIGAFAEAQSYYQRVLELVGNDRQKHIKFQHLLAEAYLGLGQYSQAQRIYIETLRIAEELGYSSSKALALCFLADIAYTRGELDSAKELYEDSKQLFREIDDTDGLIRSLHGLGNVAYDQGDISRATELFQQGMELSREQGGMWGMASTLHMTKSVRVVRDTSEVTELVRQLDNHLTQENPRATMQVMLRLGEVTHQSGEYKNVRQHLNRVLQMSQNTRDYLLAITSLLYVARMLINEGRLENAVEILLFVLYFPETSDQHVDEVEQLLYEAQTALDQSQVELIWESNKSMTLDTLIEHILGWIS